MASPHFLTGATGFVGRRLTCLLAGDGPPMRALYRPRDDAGGPPTEPPGAIEWVPGDLLEPDSYESALAGVDTVIHLAALTGRARARRFDEVNREGTRRLLAAARRQGVGRFLFVSTIGVNFPPRPPYPYARSKAAAEELVRASGLSFVIVRPAMVFGPGSPVLAGLRSLARLPVLPLVGGGAAPVQPIWVDDLCALLAEIARRGLFNGETIELGGPRALPIGELLGEIRRREGRGAGPRLPLPAAPLAALLAAAEALAGPRLPFTVGQLKTLISDGTIVPGPFYEERRAGLTGLDAMLEGSVER